jgi:hypothetical protein
MRPDDATPLDTTTEPSGRRRVPYYRKLAVWMGPRSNNETVTRRPLEHIGSGRQ